MVLDCKIGIFSPMKTQLFEALLRMVQLAPTSLEDLSIDWEDAGNRNAFLEMADRGGVAPWCYYQLVQSESFLAVPDSLKEALKSRYMVTLLANQQKLALFRQIEMVLGAAIPVALLKGMALAFSVYPDEALRPMGDLDLLVPEELVFEALDRLLSHGGVSAHIPVSRWHEAHHGHVRAIQLPPYQSLIELHARLYAHGKEAQPPGMTWQVAVTSLSSAQGSFKGLKEPYLLYHLATHLDDNAVKGGIRLGWLLDVALVLEKAADPLTLVKQVLAIHPPVNKQVLQALGWAFRLMSPRVQAALEVYLSAYLDFPDVDNFRQRPTDQHLYRHSFLQSVMQTPGWSTRLALIWYQVFPSFEYMQFYYRTSSRRGLVGDYWRRLLKGVK